MMRWIGGWTCNSHWSYTATTFKLNIPYMRDVVVKTVKVCPRSKEIIITGDLTEKKNMSLWYNNGQTCWKDESRFKSDGNPSE